MNNRKATKRALLTSVMALAMCVVMLIGTTFAWFTDTATANVNKIQSGTLDVQLIDDTLDDELTDELRWQKAAAGAGQDTLWEPGVTYLTEGFRIKNNGSLALKYKVSVNKGSTATNPNDVDLLDVIDFTLVTKNDTTGDYVALTNNEGRLAATATSDVLYLKAHMQETANNDYQNLTLEGITITVVATQDTVEFDSTTNWYDKDAAYPAYAVGTVDTAGNTVLKDKEVDHTVKLTAPANSLDGSVNKLHLEVVESAIPSGITVATTDSSVSVEVTLKDQNGTKVTAKDNTLFELEMFIGKNRTGVKMYHSGQPMTALAGSATPTEDTFTYDATTGYVTMWVSHFSPITAVFDKYNWSDFAAADYSTPVDTAKKVVTIASAEELALFSKETAAGKNYAGYTVKLAGNINLKGEEYAWTPINGFEGTFNGGNYTVSNLWVYDEREDGVGFGLFGDSKASKICDLKIHNAYVYGNSSVAAVIGSGFTTTITNVHVDGLIQLGTTTNKGYIANYNSSYIGGIIGWGYAKVTDCSVKGDDGSVIGGGRQVGGIFGFAGEGKSDRVVNCTVENVKLVGTRCVGGIIGWAHYGNNVKNCAVKNVALEVTGTETNTIGTITGTSYTNTGNTDYDEFVGNTAVNCTLTVDGKQISLIAPHDMYATYAAGSCYIKRGDDTIIYCENRSQAESIQKDGDTIVEIPADIIERMN